MKNLIKKSALTALISIAFIGAATAKPEHWIGATFTAVISTDDGSFLVTRDYYTHCRDATNAILASNPSFTLVRGCSPNL